MTPLARLVSRLVEAIRERDPGGLHRPIAIGELRRDLLPYRISRNALGLESIEDYEVLILRLVAEEDGWARTFPPEAAERCREELLGTNPDLEIVEDLDEVTVQLGAGAVTKVAELAASQPREKDALPFIDVSKPEPPKQQPPAAQPASASLKTSRPEPRRPEAPPTPKPKPKQTKPDDVESYVLPLDPLLKRTRTGPAAKPPAGAPLPPSETRRPIEKPPIEKPPAAGSAEAGSKCVYCGSTLPPGKRVAFCPFCGQQLVAIPCPSCGTEIEPGWRHCISCGHSTGSGRANV